MNITLITVLSYGKIYLLKKIIIISIIKYTKYIFLKISVKRIDNIYLKFNIFSINLKINCLINILTFISNNLFKSKQIYLNFYLISKLNLT